MTQYEPIVWDIETSGLNPMAEHYWNNQPAAKVAAVGFGILNNWRNASSWEEVECQVEVLYNDDEYELLQDVSEVFGDILQQVSGDDGSGEGFLVGYNSRSFDHTYIGARYSRKRLNGEPLTHGCKRLDMQRVCNGAGRFGTFPKQDDVAESLGFATPDEFTGADMPELVSDGRLDDVASHARADVMDLCRIFYELREDAMDEFYDHYDIEQAGNYVEEVDF